MKTNYWNENRKDNMLHLVRIFLWIVWSGLVLYIFILAFK
jgi:hypothetical protein